MCIYIYIYTHNPCGSSIMFNLPCRKHDIWRGPPILDQNLYSAAKTHKANHRQLSQHPFLQRVLPAAAQHWMLQHVGDAIGVLRWRTEYHTEGLVLIGRLHHGQQLSACRSTRPWRTRIERLDLCKAPVFHEFAPQKSNSPSPKISFHDFFTPCLSCHAQRHSRCNRIPSRTQYGHRSTHAPSHQSHRSLWVLQPRRWLALPHVAVEHLHVTSVHANRIQLN